MLYMYYVCMSLKRAVVRTTKSTLHLRNSLCNTALNTWHIHTFFKNKLCPTTVVHQLQHVDAVGCRTWVERADHRVCL